ncbi:5-dehydro-2-deoxygluconokinase [Maledivibacter halophilus]|uniref:5-dehydro-2-deoxygluconokinase n=1 Tax=Maledivibacter halophilus TaxID=36842 RepID=A0A1T5M8I3_9FIRM|nr:5-dehydro-2-deoxygluconokinase [Maledivibacter halophilus]SKC84556.1 5-dehydro-2-deoxygluconokinase [Maledivibacter halophilus]
MDNKKYDLICIGRAAVDLNAAEINRPMEETNSFSKYVGGSPANIAIGSAKLGQKVGFIGKVSDDQHGRYVKDYMNHVGVDVSNIVFDNEGHKIGLTFTEIKSPTECSILMYRDNVADLFLRPEEIHEEYIKSSKMLLISGTALSMSPSREAVLRSLEIAESNGVKIAFELDYRPYTWTNELEASIYYKLVAKRSDIIIGTRDEFNILENTENGDDLDTVNNLFKYKPELIVIKHGVKGSNAFDKKGNKYSANAYRVKVLKTFGAGDSFASAFLYALDKGVNEALNYGSASAAIVVSQHSSSDAMPTVEKIEELINSNK